MTDRKTQHVRNLLCLLHHTHTFSSTHHWILHIGRSFQRQLYSLDRWPLEHFPPAFLRRNTISRIEESQVDACLRIVRHHIGYCATGNDAWIYGDTLPPAIEALKLQKLVRQFQDRITPLLWLNPRVGSASSGGKRI